jgi:hypothetical protein
MRRAQLWVIRGDCRPRPRHRRGSGAPKAVHAYRKGRHKVGVEGTGVPPIDDHPFQSSLMARRDGTHKLFVKADLRKSIGTHGRRHASPCTCRSGHRADGAACSGLVRCRGETEDHGPRRTAYRGRTAVYVSAELPDAARSPTGVLLRSSPAIDSLQRHAGDRGQVTCRLAA